MKLLSLFATISVGLSSCGTEAGEALVENVVFLAKQSYPGEYVAGPSRSLSLVVPIDSSDDASAYTLRGRLRASRVDWIAERCGPIIYWELLGEDAWAYGLEFLQGLPLTSEADVDAFFADQVPPTPLAPGEALSTPDPDAPRRLSWTVTSQAPPELVTTALREAGDESIGLSLSKVADRIDTMAVWFAPGQLDEASKALEVLSYVAKFNDRMTREHLEQHRPSCILD